MIIKNVSISLYSIILFIISLLLLPSNILANESDLYLFEPHQTKKEDIVRLLKREGLARQRDNNKDSVIIYFKDYLYAMAHYCPTSELIYKYTCNWVYRDSLKDELFPKNESILNTNKFNKSEQYYMNVHSILVKKYGKPTKLWIHDENKYEGVTIKEKSQLDTLEYASLFSDKCYFKVYWENSERVVSLSFDNSTSLPHLEYEYIHINNLLLRSKEIVSLERDQLFGNITIGAVVVIIVLLIVYAFIRYNKVLDKEKKDRIDKLAKQIEKTQKEKEEKQRLRELEIRQLESIHNDYVNNLSERFGCCDRSIRLSTQNSDKISEILVFSETKHIVIGKIELLFSDILDCVVDDDIKERETIQTFRGNSSATSKANTGNMIGRAVVGGVLLGGTGAIIGGSTANRHTIIEHGIDTSILDKTIEHNFTIAITVKDISNPVIYLNVGSNTRLKDEIVSLMKVIISMQTQ